MKYNTMYGIHHNGIQPQKKVNCNLDGIERYHIVQNKPEAEGQI